MRPSLRALAIAICGFAVCVCASSARAQAKPDPQLRAAAGAWSRCFPAGSPVPEFPEADLLEAGAGSSLKVTRTSTGFRVEASWGGSGHEAVFGGLTLLFQPKGCAALWVRTATYDGAHADRARIGWANRSAPDDDEIRALVAAPAREDDPAHAFARAWLTQACPGGPDSELQWTGSLAGPLAPAQPWHVGPPPRSPATFWSVAKLDAIGAHAPLRPTPDDEMLPPLAGSEIAGIVVPAMEQPKRTFSAAGVDVYEAEIDDRNGARAIAIGDRASNRHRWVVVTRGCVQGSTVQWLGADGGRIVGITQSRDGRYARGDAILIVDTPSGTAWAVRFPDAIRRAHEVDDDPVRASLSGSTIALQAGKTSSQIDLAPLLAKIHD